MNIRKVGRRKEVMPMEKVNINELIKSFNVIIENLSADDNLEDVMSSMLEVFDSLMGRILPSKPMALYEDDYVSQIAIFDDKGSCEDWLRIMRNAQENSNCDKVTFKDLVKLDADGWKYPERYSTELEGMAMFTL